MENKVKIAFLSFLLISLSVFNFLNEDKLFSPSENRYLQTFPELSSDSVFSGQFNQEFEVYVNDQFIARDAWVLLNTSVNRAMGQRDNGRVYFGSDEWLFSMDSPKDQKQYDANLASLQTFTEKNSDTYNVTLMLVPTKSQIMTQYLPRHAPILNEEKLVRDIESTVSPKTQVMDLTTILKNHNNEAIYYRTDHHWTPLGAYYAYANLLGTKANPLESFSGQEVSKTFRGTEYRKAQASFISPDTIDALKHENQKVLNIKADGSLNFESLYDESFLSKSDQYRYFLGGDHSLLEIETGTLNAKHLLIIKDSFANTLIPFLIPHYESITVVDLRYYNASIESLMESRTINDILLIYNTQTLLSDRSVYGLKR